MTFDQVASAAGVSRALVHTYLGDRRGLIDAVQVQIIGRLDTWVGHGLRRADTPERALRAVVQGTFSFVESERDAWGVLAASGGFDHPALHGVRARWAATMAGAPAAPEPVEPGQAERRDLAAQGAVAAVLGGVGTWVNRGVDPTSVEAALLPLLDS